MGLLTAVKETVVGGDDGVGEELTTERDQPDGTLDATDADLLIATGNTRKEILLDQLDGHEGRVKQANLVERTGWSKSTVSRHLSELERDDVINRIQVGRCKVVLYPDDPLLSEHAVSGDRLLEQQ